VNIEQLLKKSGNAKPKRPLSSDFTNKITNHLAANPRPSRFGWLKEIFNMKWFTKPAIALSALAFLVIAGGTAYASVGGWSGIIALFGGQKVLSNGDRIVQVDAKNCNYVSAFTVTQGNKKVDSVYYRVKMGSKLTNEQVVQLVQGKCYADDQAKFDQGVLQSLYSNPLNKDKLVGGYADAAVKAITDSSISFEFVLPVGNELKTIKQTFNNIAPDVMVYQSPNKISWKDIKVGDRVSFSYRASGEALTHSETISPDKVKTDEQVLVFINKNTPEYSEAIDFQKYNGSEFEEVKPCSNQSDGYCNYAQFREAFNRN